MCPRMVSTELYTFRKLASVRSRQHDQSLHPKCHHSICKLAVLFYGNILVWTVLVQELLCTDQCFLTLLESESGFLVCYFGG